MEVALPHNHATWTTQPSSELSPRSCINATQLPSSRYMRTVVSCSWLPCADVAGHRAAGVHAGADCAHQREGVPRAQHGHLRLPRVRCTHNLLSHVFRVSMDPSINSALLLLPASPLATAL